VVLLDGGLVGGPSEVDLSSTVYDPNTGEQREVVLATDASGRPVANLYPAPCIAPTPTPPATWSEAPATTPG
jgi:hypothetical protein